MEERLSLEFLRVVENAAVAAARTMGFGDRHKADEVAVEAMRGTMDQVEMDGTIVIGEGERDEAPMLYIGEQVGSPRRPESRFSAQSTSPSIRWKAPICAPPARPIRSSSWPPREPGGLLHAPDCYMEKIIVRAGLPRRSGYRRSGEVQPQGHRALSGPPGEGSGHHGARPSAPRQI